MIKNINKNLIYLSIIAGIIIFNVVFTSPKEANAYIARGSYTICDGGCENSDNYYNSNSQSNTNYTNPVLYSTDPNKIGSNSGLKSITIIGEGFRPDSIARWNTMDKPTSYINSKKLIMELDNEDTLQDGKYVITVVNPSPEGGKFSNPKTIIVSNYMREPVKITNTTTSNTNGGYVNTGSYKAKGTTTISNTSTTKSTTTNTTKNTNIENKEEVKGENTTKEENTNCVTANTENNNKDKNSLVATSVKSNGSFLPDTIAEWLILIILIVLGVILWRKIWTTKTEKNKPLKHA